MGPLAGIRIIDLTSMLSGPWATMILGDQGADVIKVEMPGQGDHTRAGGNRRNGMAASFLNFNRNKRSIAIDLKTADGVALVKRLAASADVLVQNFRPGVVERLGLAEDDDPRRLRPTSSMSRSAASASAGRRTAQGVSTTRSSRRSPASPPCRPARTPSGRGSFAPCSRTS